ncbi:methyltransferase domain-containing protein [Ideonella sp. A 288]|uniref:methyltransferase domain-containing protein n=1 Tax=Ideonella sp. A 288 TaxID=1962181 RepID=UPI000B4B00EE|nr:methyltransferase domain-containing protein [Ideonella sp. A 288]
MVSDASIRFFDAQFQRQVGEADLCLNPFEQAALPHLRGRVLDHGCGMGNLAVAAARRGCSVVALDGSPTAIRHLRQVALAESLPISAAEADLRCHELDGDFDAVVSIGVLMFFECTVAVAQLRQLQAHVRPGGVAVVNVLVEGTTYLDMFDPAGHCLFGREDLARHFEGWEILQAEHREFPAPQGRVKSFATVVARKPAPNRH